MVETKTSHQAKLKMQTKTMLRNNTHISTTNNSIRKFITKSTHSMVISSSSKRSKLPRIILSLMSITLVEVLVVSNRISRLIHTTKSKTNRCLKESKQRCKWIRVRVARFPPKVRVSR